MRLFYKTGGVLRFITPQKLQTLSRRCEIVKMSSGNNPVYPSKPSEDHFVNLSNMRKPYENDIFSNNLAVKEPFSLFKQWFNLACQTPTIQEANAMVVATCSKSGKPSSRYVLLKRFDDRGFYFFTNYESRKGREIEENPNVALLFYWDILHRQVRIEGKVEKVPREVSEEYFYSRPFNSQVSAAISNQSHVVESREALEQKYKDNESALTGKKVPKPDCWGGYIVIPESFEFWQGLSTRLHDRILFTKSDGEHPSDEHIHSGENGWVYQLLAP